MKDLFYWFFERGRRSFKVSMILVVLIGLSAPFQPITTFAAGNNCKTSSPVSAAYNVQVCITKPSDGATVSGSRTVTATVTVAGTDPGTSKLIFYLGGEYLITDYQSAYTFMLPTNKFVDGTRLLEVEAVMRDGFTSQRASITLNFSNGIVTPPVNTKTFKPRKGTTPPTGQAFTLAAAGDGADGATYAGSVTDLIASWSPNMFLYLGDVYDDGTATEFRNWYGTSSTFYGRFRSITNPIIGNHEYASGGVAPGYFDYWDNVPRYYNYNAAGWHFIALDSNCGLIPDCAAGQAQYQWLQNDLNTNSNVCTIAYFHHPVFNVGPEGPTARMNDIWALLAQYGVDIVMSGHDHNYQRWQPLGANGAVSAAGITQFVVGAGGHGTQQFVTSDSRLAVGFDTTPNAFGALRLQLNQSGAGYQYINAAGTLLDSGSVKCSGAPADTTAPSAPTNLSATAISPQQVQLTWTPSTDNVGVTGYSIYRDGSLLATVGPMTSYDDLTVQPGTTYSYRVRARDAAGNTSGLSSAAAISTGLLLFSDGFESGGFSQWTSVSGLTVQQQEAYAGLYGARGTSAGTPTYAYEQLTQTQSELYYRLWFKVISQGANSIYLQRFRTSSNGAILGMLLTSTGKLAYRNDVTGATTTSASTVAPGSGWHELQVRVLINGTAGATEVWLDGTRINSLSKTENLGTVPIGRIQLGESSTGRTYDVALDRVALSTQFIDSANPPEGSGGPTNTPLPGSTPTRTSTPTATATGGSGAALIFPAVADARVSQASPANNYGTATTLQADSGTTDTQTSYIRFTTSGIGGAIQNATFRVYCTTNGTANGPAVYLANSSWTESGMGGVTWNTQPGLLSGTVDNKGSIGANSWVEYDVTSLVSGNGTYTFALVADGNDGVVFSSREGTEPPQLVVTMRAAAPTATRTPTATNPGAPTATRTITATATPTRTNTVVPGASITFVPVADSYINEGSPTTNYGTLSLLRMDASPVLRSYLRFDVQGVSGTVTRAALRFYANSASSRGCQASSVDDNTWTETTINFNNAPPAGTALGSVDTFTTGAWVEIDVTAYVTGNGTYSLALTTPGTTAVSLASRESGANAPQLVIETSP